MAIIFQIFKYLWASPNTLLGLLCGIGGKMQLVDGVIGQDQHCLDYSRSHNRIHVRQYESFGPFFISLYFFCSFHAWRTGQYAYRDNFFEIEAYNLDRRK